MYGFEEIDADGDRLGKMDVGKHDVIDIGKVWDCRDRCRQGYIE